MTNAPVRPDRARRRQAPSSAGTVVAVLAIAASFLYAAARLRKAVTPASILVAPAASASALPR